MIASWMLYAIALGILLAVAAVVLEHAAQLMRWPARWIWLGALGLMLFLPALGLIPDAAPSPVGTAAPLNVVSYGLSSAVASATAGRALAAPSLGSMIIGLWLLASLAVLGIASVGQVRMRCEIAGLAEDHMEGVVVRISRSTGPAVVGLFRPVIVVPEWVRSLDAERRRYVIEHERAHADAGDTWLLHAAMALVAVMPWNPAVWWAAKRLRDAVELDCDQRLVRGGASVGTYGTLLIDVAGRGFRAVAAVAPFIGRASLLARRIETLMGATPRARIARAALAAVAGGALVFVACQTKRPVPTAPPAARTGAQSDTTLIYVQRGTGGMQTKFTPPVLLSKPALVYPPLMKRAGVTGRVALQFVVRPDGHVNPQSIRVMQSTNRAFEPAARALIRGMIFRPATDGQHAVSAYLHQDVAFALDGKPAPAFPAETTMVYVRKLQPSRIPDSSRLGRVLDTIQARRSRFDSTTALDLVPTRQPSKAGGPDMPPSRALAGPAPAYPPLLKAAGITGRVLVSYVVDASGHVDPATVRVVQTSNRGFEAAAIAAIERSIFRPARHDGTAIPMRIAQEIVFTLPGRPVPPPLEAARH